GGDHPRGWHGGDATPRARSRENRVRDGGHTPSRRLSTGHVDCVDQHGDNLPGNIFGEVSSWRMEGQVVVLHVTGKLIRFPGGHPVPVSFTLKIQQFGGAGVGHWTLEVGGRLFCIELLTSGQIVYRPE